MSAETTTAPPATPELVRQAKARELGSEHIGEFLDWLQGEGIQLARYDEHDQMWGAHETPRELIARFYKIDLAKVEQEQQKLLDWAREQYR